MHNDEILSDIRKYAYYLYKSKPSIFRTFNLSKDKLVFDIFFSDKNQIYNLFVEINLTPEKNANKVFTKSLLSFADLKRGLAFIKRQLDLKTIRKELKILLKKNLIE